METTKVNPVNPSKIMQIGLGFWASKSLLTAVNMRLLTHLANGELSGQDIKKKLGLHNRGLYDFLDTLVALGFLKRSGIKETSMYSNAEDANLFLDKNKISYIGGMLEMANNRLYPFWNNLEEGLKTGKPQNETKTGGIPIFEALYADEQKLREFLKAMGGIQLGNFMMFSKTFDFTKYKTLCDVGGAGANLAIQVAKYNEHMICVSFDLPPVEPIARENINMMGLNDRISTQSGNFLNEALPKADIITMGNILHDMNIETEDGFDFSAADFNGWAKECGFTRTSVMPLSGPSSAVIAIK